MSDVVQRAAAARLKVTELSEEIEVLGKEAASLEQEARKKRDRREAAKAERQEWNKALDSLSVQQAVETAQAAAEKARAEAEGHLAAAKQLRAEAEAELAKAKEQNPTA